METASSWDSYQQTLIAVIHETKPKKAFEWGSGKSTYTISKRVESLDSVEHDSMWLITRPIENTNIIFQDNMNIYPLIKGRWDKYDLIFVDGRKRSECLAEAKGMLESEGVVMIHDAERERYQDAIHSFKHVIWTDGGHTAVMTENDDVEGRLRKCLRGL